MVYKYQTFADLLYASYSIIRRVGPDKGGYWEVLGMANSILENGEES